MFTRTSPAAYPRASAFAVATRYAGNGGAWALPRRKPCRAASLRAALAACGASPERQARKLAAAYAALVAGQPVPWPRGFAAR